MNGDYNSTMVGSLLHYNCAGSDQLAICTNSFVYKGPEYSSRYSPGDVLVAVEWVGPTLAGLRPSGIVHSATDVTRVARKSREAFPPDWEFRVWYNFKWFKELSST